MFLGRTPSSDDLPVEANAVQSALKLRPSEVQSLHYPTELERILRTISYASRTAIEESGTNMLYLVFGFLEWYESDSSTEAHLAPVLTLPVTLARGKADRTLGTFSYEMSRLSEDTEINLSLREKFKRDFGLDLPDFTQDDSFESYTSKFKGILKAKPRWRLQRKITLALLYFGKLRMYQDLDTRKWPAQARLEDHPLIKDLFEGIKRTDLTFGGEYKIDAPANQVVVPPLILDADSSQHSVLIDARQDKNLVVEGPPGTGKSQTIANLIANAFNDGKTVLFVSEKLAALEVVRRRLDDAGLGIFCLELHSHKTEKRRLLDDLEDRLKARGSFPDPALLDGKIAALQRAKSQLVDYVALLSSPYGPFTRTGFDIIWAYERYRQTLPIAPQLVEACAIPNADKMIGSDLDWNLQLLELHVKHLSEICQGSGNFREHPWYGVSNANLKYQEERELLTALQELRNKAGILYKVVDSLKSTTGFSVEPTAGSIAQLVDLRVEMPDWPQSASPEFLSALLSPGERDRVQTFLAEVVAWREKQVEFLLYFSEVPEVPSADLAKFVKLAEDARAKDCTQYSVQELESRAEASAALAKQTEKLISLFDEIIGIGRGSSACDEGALAEVCVFCQLLEETPPSLLKSRQEVLEKETASRYLAEAERESERLCIEQARLSEEFDLDAELSPEDLDKHILELQGATVLKRWFNSNFKTARRYYRELSRRPVRNPQTMATSLRDLQRFQEDFRALQSSEVYHSALGDHFRGIATNFSELRGLVEWYRNVRQRLSSQRPAAMALMTALFRSSTLRLERVRQIAKNEEVRLRVEAVKETARRDFRGSVFENVGSSGNWDF